MIKEKGFRNEELSYFKNKTQLCDIFGIKLRVCFIDAVFAYHNLNARSIASLTYHISVYDKRDDFDFRIVNFPHMDSNIPANPTYGIYISQLVRYARICTSKVDFLHRLRQVSSRLHRQGFKSAFLLRSLTKFFNRHGAIIGKFDTTLRELRTAVHE